MIIGYREQINKIVIIGQEGERMTKHLGIYGLNILGTNTYTYYNRSGEHHILDMHYIKELRLYHDKKLMIKITNNGTERHDIEYYEEV